MEEAQQYRAWFRWPRRKVSWLFFWRYVHKRFYTHSNIVITSFQLQGEMEFALASMVVNGSTVIPVLDDHTVLYRKPASSQQDSKRRAFGKKSSSKLIESLIPPLCSAEKCPPSIAFTIRLPTIYTHEGANRPLPPTYSSRLGDGIPGMLSNARMAPILLHD